MCVCVCVYVCVCVCVCACLCESNTLLYSIALYNQLFPLFCSVFVVDLLTSTCLCLSV